MTNAKPRETPKFLGQNDAACIDEVYRRIREICSAEGRSPTIDRLMGKQAPSQADDGMFAA